MTGIAPLRPLWMEFPQDKQGFTKQTEHLVGNAILVSPVVEPGVSSISIYFPGGKDEVHFKFLN